MSQKTAGSIIYERQRDIVCQKEWAYLYAVCKTANIPTAKVRLAKKLLERSSQYLAA